MSSESPATVPLRFFKALQQKDYIEAWNCLTPHSQQLIVAILAKSWRNSSANDLTQAFEKGQGVAKSYWDVFRGSIQLETWLSQSYRSYGLSGKEVIVKASPSNVTLLVYQQGREWKFGYMETFG
ncbi:MAG: hypothetical protein CVV27_04105 [Candidatus Melainabacteria bacterium HGW-Melainabacteria-1]|nr:MAG: hypothetical protein CVV27_04105 [Candidatus Melainabacteria bacterium HGW-Melainabacteria-1]